MKWLTKFEVVRLVSLDAPSGGEEENNPLIDVIADPDAESNFDRLTLSEEQHMIRKVPGEAAERLLSAKKRTVFNELLATNQMSVQTVSRIKNDTFSSLSHSLFDAIPYKLQKDIPALQDVSPHRLHHTFLMFLLRSGVDAATQQYLMEHTSFEMTLHYQHEDYDSLKKMICSIA